MTGGAGRHLFWRRYAPFLVQVRPILGAGGVLGGGPAPLQGTEPRFAAQVPTLFPHLRQNTPTPAARSGEGEQELLDDVGVNGGF